MKNRYGGMFVSSGSLPALPGDFDRALEASLPAWQAAGMNVVWLELMSSQAALLPVAIRHGFRFHHCAPDALMLVKALVEGACIPTGSTHTIGVGGVVLSPRRELLVVLEQRDVSTRPGHFKLPGGMLEKNEHLSEAVVREVFEETGVRTRFEGMIGFRHHHQGQFDTSNIYAACLLRPENLDITPDGSEIAEAKWMAVEEYLASEQVGAYNKCAVEAALASEPLASIKLDGYMNSPNEYEIFF